MAMRYDYYAFQQEHLIDSLNKLKQASEKFEQDKAAKDAVKIEPHISYLWCEAIKSELKNNIRESWRKNLTAKKKPEDFGFIPKISDLENLPVLSFILMVPFKLQKSYLSKDDRAFHLLDNPIRKDKVFQTPMVASASWKGALRSALWQMGYKEKNQQIIRLFGNEHQEEDHKNLKSGRLYFYPTFFDEIDLEVINPHGRKKGTSKRGPIYIECVPKDIKGKPVISDLVIIYVPFGSIDESQVAEDLELVVEGIKAMLTVYGFGAKTSSGFGIANQQGIGQIVINCSFTPQIPQRPQEPEYPERLRLFLEQYPNEDFRLSPKEWRKSHNATQRQQESYRKTRNERLIYQDTLKTYESQLLNWETQANTPPLPQISKNFNTLVEMVSKAKEIAEHINQRKEVSHES